MKVIVADVMGMCFGVRDAIRAAEGVLQPATVTIHGELVHNPQVLDALASRGFATQPEAQREQIPATSHVLITAHGISDRIRQRLVAAGKTLIDTTCPLVHRAHQAALQLQAEGCFVLVIGKPDHVEVLGLTGDLDRFAVVERAEDVRTYDAPRIGVISQTTTTPLQAREIVRAIQTRNAGRIVHFVDTICLPTRMRQAAAERLLGQVQALVVVGGRHSNNTRQLGLLAAAHGLPWFQVETAAELDLRALSRFEVGGLTAGTSTLDGVIRAGHEARQAIEPIPAACHRGWQTAEAPAV